MPSSRSVSPASILQWLNLTPSPYGNFKLSGNGSLITYDFDKEVGSIAPLSYSGTGTIGLAFTEAKNFVEEWSDSSNGEFKRLDYGPSYPSHAHGWSSGLTSALSNYILGLDVVEPAGSQWTLAPQFGDLMHVEGGFAMGLGAFSALWSVHG